MSLFGNKNIVPDDIAHEIALRLYIRHNRSLEFNIDEDIERYHHEGVFRRVVVDVVGPL